MRYGSNAAKELGKAVSIRPRLKKINWPRAEMFRKQAAEQRKAQLREKRHQLILKYNKLKLMDADIVAKRIIEGAGGRSEAKSLVTSYLGSMIREYKRLGLPTKGLEKARLNPDKIVDNIINRRTLKGGYLIGLFATKEDREKIRKRMGKLADELI